MRWLTAQELSKIARKSQVSDKNIPERTIRHMASQKRILSKRQGKTWLIDPMSAINAGLYIDPVTLDSLKLKKEVPDTSGIPNPANLEKIQDSETANEKKYKKLGELGVYNELKELYLQKFADKDGAIKDSIKQTLYHLALGFYEYLQVNKAEYFKRARKHLVGAIVEDDLASTDRSEWRDQIENSIMPGIVGLIRKQEGGKRGRGQGHRETSREGQSKTTGKD